MAVEKVTVLPGWVTLILAEIGLLPETFISVLNGLADEYDVPAEYVAAVKDWIAQSVDVTANALQAAALGVYAEWVSGNPGVDPQAGSSA